MLGGAHRIAKGLQMSEIFSIIPVPAFIAIALLGLILAVIASAPTAWVDRAEKALKKDDGPKET